MMHELFLSPFFGIGLSIAAFWVGTWIRKKTGLVLCNPLVLAIVIVSGVLLIFKIPYEEYNEGGALINMFLAPATACLAVSIYTRAELLKKNWLPIVVGASCGSLASMGSVLLMRNRGRHERTGDRCLRYPYRTVFDDFAALKLAAPCGQKLRHGHKNYSTDVRTAQRQTTAARGAKWGRAWRKWEKGQIGSKWM